MSDLVARVCAILDVMVTATVSEMDKVICNSASTSPFEPPPGTENKPESSDDKVDETRLVLVLLAGLVFLRLQQRRPDQQLIIEIQQLANCFTV